MFHCAFPDLSTRFALNPPSSSSILNHPHDLSISRPHIRLPQTIPPPTFPSIPTRRLWRRHTTTLPQTRNRMEIRFCITSLFAPVGASFIYASLMARVEVQRFRISSFSAGGAGTRCVAGVSATRDMADRSLRLSAGRLVVRVSQRAMGFVCRC